MKKLIHFFASKQLIVNVITIFVIFAGITTYNSLQKQAFPNVDEGGVSIITQYPGAAPEDVELNVSIPIEDELKTIDGIDKFYSNSYENYSAVWVIFDPDESKNFDKIKQDIRRALDGITDFPPEVTDRPKMYEWGGKYVEVVQVGICGKNITEKDLQLKAKELKNKLKESPYVSKIDEIGMRNREIHIEMDLDKMNSYYISFEEVIDAIKRHNIQLTSGTLKSYLAERTIVTISRFENILDVRNVIIKSNYDGKKILLSDVAEVFDTYEHEGSRYRFNGNRGIIFEVYKKQSKDIVKASDNMKKIVKEFNENLEDDNIEVSVTMDFSEPTKLRLKVVSNNALIGLALVITVLFIFLNFKNAFWTALGIPFSIFFCLMLLPFFGVTINSISLLGFIIVLGMIVDDAIVISENIYRHKLKGELGIKITVEATTEVGFAVLTTVLTTIFAFFPLLIMKGVVGEYSREVPIVIALILTGSLFESLFILPGHTTHSLKKGPKIILGFVLGSLIGFGLAKYFNLTFENNALNILYYTFFTIFSGIIISLIFAFLYKEDINLKEKRFIIFLRKGYGFLLNNILKFRYLMILILIAVIGIGFITYKSMKYEMFPDIEPNIIEINGEVTGGRSLDYTQDKVKIIEDFVLNNYDKKELFAFGSHIGRSGYKEKFRIRMMLSSDEKRKLKADKVIDDIKKKINEEKSFINMSYEARYIGAPNIGSGIDIEIAGNDDAIRKKITDMVVKDLESVNGISYITRTDQITKKEIKIIPRYDKVAQYGVTAYNIANVTKIAYDGHIATDIQTPDEKIPYRVLLDNKYRSKISTIDKLKVLNSSNKLIPIKEMVDIYEGEALTEIRHFNGYRTTTIHTELDSKKTTPKELFDRFNKKYQNISNEYYGFRINLGGSAEFSAETMNELLSTMFIAIAGIFMLLIFLFQSVSQPFIVMAVIPFGFFGVVFAFFFHGMQLSYMCFMGLIGLSGVVINDSLIMVEYINQLRDKDKNKDKNLIHIVKEGALTRLRPVILTTVTTFVGLLPTAYGIGGKDSMVLPTAMALSWGIVFGTFITLLIVPIFYLIERDIRLLFKKTIPKLFKKSK